jgi:hypothetical protein
MVKFTYVLSSPAYPKITLPFLEYVKKFVGNVMPQIALFERKLIEYLPHEPSHKPLSSNG